MSSFNPLTFEKMSEHYNSLLKSGLQSDVVLVAGEKELRAHKVVLSARSPVFSAMFAHVSTKEAQENRVEIVDMDEEVLESFVRYIYTGKVDTLDQFSGDLLIAADKYQLASLKSICEAHLLSVVITTETVSDLLALADMYQITVLTSKCLRYITDNATQVRTTEGWSKIQARADLVEKFKLLNLNYSKEEKKKWNKSIQNIMPFNMVSFDPLIFNEISEHYEALLKSGKLSDVVLLADDKELHAHKVILSARSAEFAAMFVTHDSTKETQDNRVQITDVDVEVLKVLIKYIYTGKVEELELHTKLFLAADKYRLDCIKSICEQRLLSHILPESVSDQLIFADMCSNVKLYKECLDYIIDSFEHPQVMTSEGWKRIMVRADLLAALYEHFHGKYLNLIDKIRMKSVQAGTFMNEYRRIIHDHDKKVAKWATKEDGNVLDWTTTLGPYLDFEEDSFDYSDVIINSKDEMTDMVLVVGNKELKVHKHVLSAGSPVFASMFAHLSTKEAQETRVEMVDVDVEVVKLLIEYIYTGKVIGSARYAAADLLLAANKYQLDGFKSICVQKLLSQISTESVSDLVIFADVHQVTELYGKCLDYIDHNGTQVLASEGWKRIVLKTDLLAKICERLNWSFAELLLSPITIDSVLNLFILADMHQFSELTDKCADCITDNVIEVMQQKDWKKVVVKTDLMVILFEHLREKNAELVYEERIYVYENLDDDDDDVNDGYNDDEDDRRRYRDRDEYNRDN